MSHTNVSRPFQSDFLAIPECPLVYWLRREFFKRHLQQFKQRPIAWHLVSLERNFEAFVLYHRPSRVTLQRLRVQYAGSLIERLRTDQERA